MFDSFARTTGERIRYYRKHIHMTQKELAEYCKVSEPAIRNYELGNRIPDYEMLQTIAEALQVSYYALADPDIASLIGGIHVLFRMEYAYGLKPVSINGKTGLMLESAEQDTEEDIFQKILDVWLKARMKLESGEWDKETYFEWESKYPAFTKQFTPGVRQSEGTPGTDAEKKQKHKRPRK